MSFKPELAEVRKQLIILVPVVVGLLILTMISVLSLTAISTRKQLRNYGVLYLCGGRRRQCAFIIIGKTQPKEILKAE